MTQSFAYDLKTYHTFGFNSFAHQLIEVDSVDDIQKLIEEGAFLKPFFVLGGGSNVLFKSKVTGLVVHPVMQGINALSETLNDIIIEIGAGVEWDELVRFCVEREYYGLENLSLIPGSVGAAPVQNVGAYGAEAGDCIDSVFAIDVLTGEMLQLSHNDCAFGYRDSVFKNALKGRVIIYKVHFKLCKIPLLNLGYGHVLQAVEALGDINIANVRKAIVDIRQSKLPNPKEVGNAGSFFKNPVVSTELALLLKNRFPEMPEYKINDQLVKIPAGWLIETAGWKGKQIGNAAVHSKQALVLVNLGNATCEEILNLSSAIEVDIASIFGIQLEKEVIVVE